MRARWSKLGAYMDAAEHDVLAYLTFSEHHRAKLPGTNPLKRLDKEMKRRADVVGIFPNEDAITHLIGAVLLEQNDEYQLQCRYMQVEGMATLATPGETRSALVTVRSRRCGYGRRARLLLPIRSTGLSWRSRSLRLTTPRLAHIVGAGDERPIPVAR